jgi:hypothetical protein
MVYFQTKNTLLGQFGRALKWKKVGLFYGHFVYISTIWNILWLYGDLVAIGYIFPLFGILCQEKSCNPVQNCLIKSTPDPREEIGGQAVVLFRHPIALHCDGDGLADPLAVHVVLGSML